MLSKFPSSSQKQVIGGIASDSWLQHCRASWMAKNEDYLGLDHYGRPVLVERMGTWAVQKVVEATEEM